MCAIYAYASSISLPILCSTLVLNILFDYDKKREKRLYKKEEIYNCIIKGEKRFFKYGAYFQWKNENIIKGECISKALN